MSIFNWHSEYASIVTCWYIINMLFSFQQLYDLVAEIHNILCDFRGLIKMYTFTTWINVLQRDIVTVFFLHLCSNCFVCDVWDANL